MFIRGCFTIIIIIFFVHPRFIEFSHCFFFPTGLVVELTLKETGGPLLREGFALGQYLSGRAVSFPSLQVSDPRKLRADFSSHKSDRRKLFVVLMWLIRTD